MSDSFYFLPPSDADIRVSMCFPQVSTRNPEDSEMRGILPLRTFIRFSWLTGLADFRENATEKGPLKAMDGRSRSPYGFSETYGGTREAKDGETRGGEDG